MGPAHGSRDHEPCSEDNTISPETDALEAMTKMQRTGRSPLLVMDRSQLVGILSLRDQCDKARVAWFFKQWGGTRKSKAGRELDGYTYDGLPARVQLPVLADDARKARIAEIAELFPSSPKPESPGLFAAL